MVMCLVREYSAYSTTECISFLICKYSSRIELLHNNWMPFVRLNNSVIFVNENYQKRKK